MIEGDVSERTFLHLSNWSDPFEAGTFDTTAAWKESHYWSSRLDTDEWCRAREEPDGSFRMGALVFPKGHDFISLMRRFKYASDLAKELVFEEVRRVEFPQRPSRRSCLFLLDEHHDVEAYAKTMWGGLDRRTLYHVAVISGRVHRATVSALNCNTNLHAGLVTNARAYWTHAATSLDTEVLFEGVCQMTRIK